MLVTQFRHGVLTARVYHNAVSKDLVRRRLVFHMILVSPPYARIGGVF